MGKKKGGKKPQRGVRSEGLALILLFLLGVGVYWNTLGHGFVFDDTPLIVQNPQVYNLEWGEILSSAGYRPVRTLTYALNYVLGGEDPFGYHLFNVLLHALNGIVLFRLLQMWAGFNAAWVGALLFAVHPAQTAAVAYVSGRKDLLAAFFVFLALILYTRYRRHGGRERLLWMALLFVLGILSKEVVIAAPALLVLVDAFAFPPDLERGGSQSFLQGVMGAFRRSSKIYGIFLAISALGLFYAIVITGATRMIGLWGGSWSTNLGTSLKLFAHYLGLVLWPHPLLADYSGSVFPVSRGLLEGATLLALAVLVVFLVAAVLLHRHNPLITMGMLWFLAMLLPILHLIPFHEIAADHFLYVPMAGVALALGVTLRPLLEAPRWRRGVAVGVHALFVALAFLAVVRNQDWKDTQAIWEATYREAPNSFRANVNLGHVYWEQGASDTELRQRGIELTERALELTPGNPLAMTNLGSMLYEKANSLYVSRDPGGQSAAQRARHLAEVERIIERAVRLLNGALEGKPGDGSTLSNLGNCLRLRAHLEIERGDPESAARNRKLAEQCYQSALNGDPRREVKAVWYNYGVLYLELGDYAKAVEALQNFLATYPNHADGQARLGITYLEMGQPEEAVPPLEVAMRLRPNLTILGSLGQAYEMSGQLRKAIGVYGNVAATYAGTDQAKAYYNMAFLSQRLGEMELAVTWMDRVARQEDDPMLAAAARSWLETNDPREEK